MSPNIPVGTEVGQRSPFTGNIIREKIVIPPRTGAVTRRTPSAPSRVGQNVQQRSKELQDAGISRVYADQIANAEARGQTLTNIKPDMARQIDRAQRTQGVRSGAVRQEEIREMAKPEFIRPTRLQLDQLARAQASIKQRDDARQLVADKPVLTLGKLLEISGRQVEGKSEMTVLKDKGGKVVGITDSATKQSFLIPDTDRKEVERIIKQTQLEREFSPREYKRSPRTIIEKVEGLGKSLVNLEANIGTAVRGYLGSVGKGVLKTFTPSNDANPLNLLRRLGVNVPDNRRVRAIDTFYDKYNQVIKKDKNILKDKDVQNAALLAGIIYVPLLVKAYSSFNLGYSGAGLVDALIKRDYKSAVKRGLSAGISALILLGMGKKPKTGAPETGAPIGTIYKDKGVWKITTKGGRVVTIPKKYYNVLSRAEKTGRIPRLKRTEVARAVAKEKAKKPLTRFEKELIKISTERKTLANLVKDGKKLASSSGLKGEAKKEFTRLYVKYQTAPTKANIRAFNNFAKKKALEQIKVTPDKRVIGRAKPKPKIADVTKLDLKMSNAIFKAKYGITKSKVQRIINDFVKQAKSLGATPKQLDQVKKLSFKKAVGKKVSNKLKRLMNNIAKTGLKEKLKKVVSRVDREARKQGFRNAIQKKRYEELFRSYKSGAISNKGLRAMRKIEKDMLKLKTAVSKKKVAEFKRLQKNLINQAIAKLKSGTLAVKNKKYVVKGVAKQKLSKENTERLLLQVNERLKVLERQRVSRERAINRMNAKKALKEITNGKVVQMTPQVKGELKQMMNNEMFRTLKAKKLIELGKTPKLSPLTKAQKKAILKEAPKKIREARLERKRLKRKKAVKEVDGELKLTAKARKDLRKGILRQIEREKNVARKILKGEIKGNYDVILDKNLGVTIKPKITKLKNIRSATNLLKKKNVPRDAVQKVNKDGTIQILKTKKLTEKLPTPLKKQVVQAKKQAVSKLESQLKQQQQTLKKKLKKLKGTKAKISIGEATRRFGKLTTAVLSGLVAITNLSNAMSKKGREVNSLLGKTALTEAQKRKLDQSQKKGLDLIQDQQKELEKLSDPDIKNDLTTNQIIKINQKIREIEKLKEIFKKKPVKKIPKKKKPEEVRLPELSWDKKPPKGKTFLVNVIVRIRGRNRVIPLRTTPNRALKFIASKVDNTTARSFDLKIVGLTKKKDIKTKVSLRKFRQKKTRGSPVLQIVERSKYAIDTAGEKKGLSLAKLLRKKNAKKTKSSKIRKRRSKKRATRKKRK